MYAICRHLFKGLPIPDDATRVAAWPGYEVHGYDYILVAFESMLSVHDGFLSQRPAPIFLRSSDGFVHVVNGPKNYALCEGYPCNHRSGVLHVAVRVGEFHKYLIIS